MSWLRIDDQIAFHQKTIAAGNEAFGAWVRMGAHSCAYGTDGFLDEATALTFTSKKMIARLIKVGFLDVAPEGYRIHDFHDWNGTAEEVAARRKERRAAGARGAAKRWKRDSSPIATAIAPAIAPAIANRWLSDAPSPSPSPVPENPEDPPSPPGGDFHEDFAGESPPDPESLAGPTEPDRASGTMPAGASRPRDPSDDGLIGAGLGIYREAIAKATGVPQGSTPRDWDQQRAIAAAIQTHASGYRGEEIQAWLRANAAEYVRQRRDSAKYEGGWRAQKFLEFLATEGSVGPDGLRKRPTPPRIAPARPSEDVATGAERAELAKALLAANGGGSL